jgi:hypothetical protein
MKMIKSSDIMQKKKYWYRNYFCLLDSKEMVDNREEK